MARLARAVTADVPHHVTQRGNRWQPTFFGDADHRLYRDLLASGCRRHGVAVWACCPMPDHAHLIPAPDEADGLRLALGEAHQRYTHAIDQREGWVGHLWQGRFVSCALDEVHLIAAVRYVELNPVRAGLAARTEDWPWGSARAHHLAGEGDELVGVAPLRDAIGDWSTFLAGSPGEEAMAAWRRHERTGRPLGSRTFVAALEQQLGRRLRSGKPGRPRVARREVNCVGCPRNSRAREPVGPDDAGAPVAA